MIALAFVAGVAVGLLLEAAAIVYIIWRIL